MDRTYKPKHILLTGGCGFIGTNFVHYLLNHTKDIQITNLDLLTYAGRRENLSAFESDPRYTFVQGNVCDYKLVKKLLAPCDAIIHMAAESHVDRSIIDGSIFAQTNIIGTQTLLDAMREVDPENQKRFLFVSTDEVYGELSLENTAEKFTEQSPLQPRSPYAASKASADMLVQAYHHTYGLQTLISRCSNNFGPYQHPEKLIPLFVTNLLQNKKVPLYGDGKNVRDWIFVEDHVKGLLTIMNKAHAGSIYNIGANCEKSNIELTNQILTLLHAPPSIISYVQDRLGHDRRYALNTTLIETQLHWQAEKTQFNKHLEATIRWYQEHPNWWQPQ